MEKLTMNKNKAVVLICIAYAFSLLSCWAAVDVSIDGVRIIRTGITPFAVVALALIIYACHRKQINGTLICLGAVILLIAEIYYLLTWPIPAINNGINIGFSIQHIQAGAIISFSLALLLFLIGIIETIRTNKK